MKLSILLLALILLVSSCKMGASGVWGEQAAAEKIDADKMNKGIAELTEPFQAFWELRASSESVSRTETGAAGYVYQLDQGSLSVADSSGAELWRSGNDWWVDDFKLGDVDGDGLEDFVFSLWKSYRFGEMHPSRLKNDDETVRNHLFVYTILSGYVKAVWGSSDLPYPIYRFELDPSGTVTAVSSGMLLITYEGEYREDYAQTAAIKRLYAWQGWGFVPLNP